MLNNKQKKTIAKIWNSEENSKQKVPNQRTKSKDKTHQTNEQIISGQNFTYEIRSGILLSLLFIHIGRYCFAVRGIF